MAIWPLQKRARHAHRDEAPCPRAEGAGRPRDAGRVSGWRYREASPGGCSCGLRQDDSGGAARSSQGESRPFGWVPGNLAEAHEILVGAAPGLGAAPQSPLAFSLNELRGAEAADASVCASQRWPGRPASVRRARQAPASCPGGLSQSASQLPHLTSIGGSRLDSPATHPRCDGCGYHGSLRDRRAAPGCDGRGHDRSLRNRRADDTDSSNACWSERHFQSPAVAVASSASIEAMIAWMGIRPLAISWPPERRAADANGAAHRFSQMSTPAVLPGSLADPRGSRPHLPLRAPPREWEWRGPQVLPDEHSGSASRLHGSREVLDVVLSQQLPKPGLDCLQLSELTDIGELRRLDGPVRVFREDQYIDHADDSGVDQRSQLCRHLTREVARSRRELDDEVVNGT